MFLWLLMREQKCLDAVCVWEIKRELMIIQRYFLPLLVTSIIAWVKVRKCILGSAELAAVCALLGRIPTVQEYLDIVAKKIHPFAENLYRYLNFDQIAGFEDEGRVISKEEQALLV